MRRWEGVGGADGPQGWGATLSRHRVVLVLVLLAIVQVGVFAVRSWDGPPPGRRIAVGDELGSLLVLDASGLRRPLAERTPRVLLVFHSECAHCRRVAPEWKEWLETPGNADGVVAVSAEPLTSAVAYAEEHGWGVDVVRVDASELGGREHALTSRTPWVFALDRDGNVLGEGHGIRLPELAGLTTLPGESAGGGG